MRGCNCAPSDEGDGEGDELHEDDKGDAGGPFAQGPECSWDDASGGSAEVVAGDVDTGGSDARSGRRGDAEMALRGGLCDEDSAGEGGESDDDDRERMDEGQEDSGDGAGDGAADSGAEADAGDEVSGKRGDDKADEIDEEKRAERGD